MSTERKDPQQHADELEHQYAELKKLREEILLRGEKLRREARQQKPEEK